jgi:hypothetical protein
MNDLWVLRIDSASKEVREGLSFTWIEVKMNGIPPSPRGRHQCVVDFTSQGEGRILIFGGSDEVRVRDRDRVRVRVRDSVKVKKNSPDKLNLKHNPYPNPNFNTNPNFF